MGPIQNENLYLHGLNLLPQLGPKRLMQLGNYFGSFQTAYLARASELAASGLSDDIAEAIVSHRQTLDLDTELKNLNAEAIFLVSFKDSAYPQLLLEIPALPPLLYVKGTLPANDELMLAVVGTRKITNYGRAVVPQILENLVDLGTTIISGLAFGVDAAAHSVALEKGGRSIAVLGCGLDEKSLYPKEHQYLASQIIETGGALISEHPVGRPALKQNFVSRNRIISGMAMGTLVVECGLKSGALITAQHALEQNRQVYAVPGPIYASESQGPNNLLKLGAKCVTCAEDILNDLNITPVDLQLPEAVKVEATTKERTLLQQLSFEPKNIDEIIKNCELDAGEVSAHLIYLEMRGLVKNLGGQQYVLARRIK